MKQVEDETSADLVDARKADEDRKANHLANVAAKKRRSPVQRCRADVNSVSKADESADAEKSMFELYPVQSTAVLSCAGQVETTIAESMFECQLSVSHAAVRTASVREQSRGKQGGRDLNDCSGERGRTRGDGERTRWLAGALHSPMEECGDSYPIFPITDTFNTVYNPLHKSTTRAGALVTSTILPTRVGPGQDPQSPVPQKWEEAVGSSQAPQPNMPNAHKSHAQLPHGSGARATIHSTTRSRRAPDWRSLFAS